MRGRLTVGALVVLVALDMVLVVAAVRHTRGVPDAAPVAQAAATADPPAVSETPSSTPSARPPVPDLLSVAGDGTVLRASRGRCDGRSPALVERLDVGGRDFADVTPPHLQAVLRVQAESRSALWVVGMDDQCSLHVFRTEDAGGTWAATGADGAWHLTADQAARAVVSPVGRRDVPCVPRTLSTVDAGVIRLLCTHGRVLGTADNGETWVTLGNLDGAAAIRFLSPAHGFALAPRPACRSTVFETRDGGQAWRSVGCAGRGRPRALAGEPGRLAAEVGPRLLVSTDGGRSWAPPA